MIFIDTGAFVGRSVQRDQHHEEALAAWERLREERLPCVTTSHVLDETLTLLGRRAGHPFAASRGRVLFGSRSLKIVRAEARDELAALAHFERFADQGVSFTDAVSFAVMLRLRIARAFTFDHHFRLAGFEVWPGPNGGR